MKQCKYCNWFDEVEKNGFCHRYPPVSGNGDGELHDTFPLVDDDDWCGEFEAKD